MKKFRLHGNTANWDALKVVALNTTTEQNETRTSIPSDMKMYVHVVNNYYRVYDKNVRQILHGEVSYEDNAEMLERFTSATRKPAFALYHNGVVVGFATLHHRHRIKTYKAVLRFEVEMPTEVKARTREEALAKLTEYANAAAESISGENNALFNGVEITEVVR